MDDSKRYEHGDIECIEAIQAALSTEEFRGFCKGCAMKYLWREAYKGKDDDLFKAVDYIMFALDYRREEDIKDDDAWNDEDYEWFESCLKKAGFKF